ncbi:MAG: sigma-54 dependent transcriptional regulator [Bdellovibrio sp.]
MLEESPIHILLVEDDRYFRLNVSTQMKKYGRVIPSSNVATAIEAMENNRVDIAFIDLNLENEKVLTGLEVLKAALAKNITTVILTGHNSKEVIHAAYEAGCHHYYTKSDFLDRLDEYVAPLIESLESKKHESFFNETFITTDEMLKSKIKFLTTQARNTDQKILITGPTGVGKTKLAEYLHSFSETKGPFLAVNLSEMPENLIESMLFGHKKGAFTGAVTDKVGILSLVNGGTLFLDEIGATPAHLQAKLLKVIEEKVFTPIGSNEKIHTNFRLISATCENLIEKIHNKEMRLDFYFRIKGIEIEIPGLKHRRTDISPLLDHFASLGPRKIAFSKGARRLLESYDWHGNIRELRDLITELRSTTTGMITEELLPNHIRHNTNIFEIDDREEKGFLTQKMRDAIKTYGLPYVIQEIEKEALLEARHEHGQHLNEIARRLQISKSVYYRIQDAIEKETRYEA